MSKLSPAPKLRGDPASPIRPRSGGWRGRAPYYAVLALLAVLVLAYIDGGEEPIRPIVQSVSVPGAGNR